MVYFKFKTDCDVTVFDGTRVDNDASSTSVNHDVSVVFTCKSGYSNPERISATHVCKDGTLDPDPSTHMFNCYQGKNSLCYILLFWITELYVILCRN